MRRILTTLLPLLILVCLPLSIHAQGKADEQALENLMRLINGTRDEAVLNRIIADEYIGIDFQDHYMNKDTLIAVKRSNGGDDGIARTYDQFTFTFPNNCVAVMTYRTTLRRGNGVDYAKSRHVYVRTSDGWKLFSSVIRRI